MKKKILKIMIICLTAIGIGYLLFLMITNLLIRIKLNGSMVVNIPYQNTYNDEGVNAYFLKKDINSKVVVKDNVNYEKIGNYYIKYSLNYFGINKTIKRVINIIDDESPIITLKGANPLYISYGSNYKEPGYETTDNYDKILKVEIDGLKEINSKQAGEYLLEYKVFDTSGNYSIAKRKVIVEERIVVKNGVTYVEGILVVNKKYSIPENYGNGVNQEAYSQLKILQNDALKNGFVIDLISGYRSYDRQKNIYNNYVKTYGQDEADTFSAKPGHSEHQTGLAFDVGKLDDDYGETEEGKWLAQNAHLYGFIIRYPKEKQDITGYQYEPWHIRYLGVEVATKVYKSGLCLEEYLNL